MLSWSKGITQLVRSTVKVGSRQIRPCTSSNRPSTLFHPPLLRRNVSDNPRHGSQWCHIPTNKMFQTGGFQDLRGNTWEESTSPAGGTGFDLGVRNARHDESHVIDSGNEEKLKYKDREYYSDSDSSESDSDDYELECSEEFTLPSNITKLGYDNICDLIGKCQPTSVTAKPPESVLVGGEFPITYFINNGFNPECIVSNNVKQLKKFSSVVDDVLLYWALRNDITSCTPMHSDVIATFKAADFRNIKPKPSAIPLTVIFDGLSDSSLMEKAMRAVIAIGCNKVIFTDDCSNPWSEQLLKSCGSGVLNLPLELSLTWQHIEEAVAGNAKVFVIGGGKDIGKEKLPSVDLYTSSPWEQGEAVIVCTTSTTVSDFCPRRNGKQLSLPEGVETGYIDSITQLLIAGLDFRRQFQDDKKMKSQGR